MLKTEAAKERLAQWIVPTEEKTLASRLRALPDPLCALATEVWDLDEKLSQRNYNWQQRKQEERRQALRLDRLNSHDLQRLFAAVAPELSAAIAAAWELQKTAPYQLGYARKAFRAPQQPELTAVNRRDWLVTLGNLADNYRVDALTPEWLASWAIHLQQGYHSYASEVGVLLAGVLAADLPQADEVFEILRLSLTNQHEIGGMGRHITGALLLADREAGWELIEKTLLAAQRQEGLRQAILESIDFAHPVAFRRMLRLILDQDLIRFSATVRAVDVWFGHLWSAATPGVIKKMLAQLVEFLDDPKARDKAIKGKDANAAFLALWSTAVDDVHASIAPAEGLLKSRSVEMRYVAARHLVNLDVNEARRALEPALADGDLRIAMLALQAGSDDDLDELEPMSGGQRFEQLEGLLQRVPPKPTKLEPLVWPWTEAQAKRSDVAQHLIPALESRPPLRLLPHLSAFEGYGRVSAVNKIIEAKPWSAETRQAILDLAGDASEGVRAAAIRALQDASDLKPAEFPQLESCLTRKASDLRQGLLRLFLKHSDELAVASAERLLGAKDAQQRLAGLELLRLLTDGQRQLDRCRQAAHGYVATRKKISQEEQSQIDEIVKDKSTIVTLDNALGLLNHAERTPVTPPRRRDVMFITSAAVACLKSLDDLVHEHRDATVVTTNYRNEKEEQLLGGIRWGFPSPDPRKPLGKQLAHLPLAEVWQAWEASRDGTLRDADQRELVRAHLWAQFEDEWDFKAWEQWANKKQVPERHQAAQLLSGGNSFAKLRYQRVVCGVLEWLMLLQPVETNDYFLDAAETAFSLLPQTDLEAICRPQPNSDADDDDEVSDWREAKPIAIWIDAVNGYGGKLTPEQRLRYWRLLHWRDEPLPGAKRQRPDVSLLLDAYELGGANLADLTESLLGPRGKGRWSSEGFDLLALLTRRKQSKETRAFLDKHPEVRQLAETAVSRILEIELARGDAATPATQPAAQISALLGTAMLRRLLQTLGKQEFKTGSYWRRNEKDRRESITHLIGRTFPSSTDTPEAFSQVMKEAVKAGEFPEERLLQLAFLAPQWTKFLQAYFGWEHFDEGIYWFLAHMRYVWGLTENAALAAGEEDRDEEEDSPEQPADDDSDQADSDSGDVDAESASPSQSSAKKLSPWERLIVERSPLSAADRDAGAIDVQWFRRTYEQVGSQRWELLAAAARFAANASQAKRARFIGDVLLNKVPRKDLVDGIKKKQLKEYVRLLGLLPLAKGKKGETDLRERCLILREYRTYANSLSGLTKPEALRSWEIGMQNLAQTAGYADPMRLQWAVGAEMYADLAKGPVSVTKSGVTVTLSLDERSVPSLSVLKGDKPLKSVPPAIKKDKKVLELTSRVQDIKRQASSIRQSLESAMNRGDTFTAEELRTWSGHALLAPQLSRLVIVGEGIMGYPVKAGKALSNFQGKLEPIKPKETLRIAHSHDLYSSKHWPDWQRECFQAERRQPFKQVFRELYILTKQEKKDGTVSRRYAGQQVQPKQAMALFGSRGWNTAEGVFKVFHDEGITVDVSFQFGFSTPLEVEGWTLAGIEFHRRDDSKPLKLAAVPARVFSEVMRDIDLVVSVAHAGGVDPEASASTVEMRSNLLRETCALLQLKNVKLKPSHAVIAGDLSDYSVHLGSGVVHRLPGGAVCLIPVHSQHRGRLFLPFADDDPRTAEVISKVLLLARDQEIQDPTILEQLRS